MNAEKKEKLNKKIVLERKIGILNYIRIKELDGK